MNKLTARSKTVIKLNGKYGELVDITINKGSDIIDGLNTMLPLIGIHDSLVWNTRAEPWVKVSDNLPPCGVKVLAVFKNQLGYPRRICGHYVPRWTVVSGEDYTYEEYCEETDTYYQREGWYEDIENWGDFSCIHVCEGEITHWMLLPSIPY